MVNSAVKLLPARVYNLVDFFTWRQKTLHSNRACYSSMSIKSTLMPLRICGDSNDILCTELISRPCHKAVIKPLNRYAPYQLSMLNLLESVDYLWLISQNTSINLIISELPAPLISTLNTSICVKHGWSGTITMYKLGAYLFNLVRFDLSCWEED